MTITVTQTPVTIDGITRNQINVIPGSGGIVNSVTAGDDIAVDATLPAAPVVSLDTSGSTNLQANEIKFNQTPTPTANATGQTYYDNNNHTLSTVLENGVTLQHGQEIHVWAKNTSGSAITNGRAVSITNGGGSFTAVRYTDPTDEASAHGFIGVATQTIDNNAFGYITVYGLVRDINTNGFTEGGLLYVAADGTLTQARPETRHICIVGAVEYAHSSQGRILVAPDRIHPDFGGSVSLPSTAGTAVLVDGAYGWKDLEGGIYPDISGVDAPTLTTYRGAIREYLFDANDKVDCRFHMPHDWAPGSDLYFHVHWSHNGTAISGTLQYTISASYSKGHNQADFSAPVATAVSVSTPNIATVPRYRHRIEEFQLTSPTPSASQIDRDDLEVDGILLVNLQMNAIPTITGGAAGVFIHFIDLHYQSTETATKNKAPNFYA